LMSESQDKNIIAQCKTMIKVNQDWLANFDKLDTNHDGMLDENERK
jgi:hypothetical protein